MEPVNHEQQQQVSDECDSNLNRFGWLISNGMVEMEEGNRDHNIIMRNFLLGMGPLVIDTSIVAIHKNLSTTLTGKSRLVSFKIYSEAVANKCGGDANVRFAWYGAPKAQTDLILRHGFNQNGVCLSNHKLSIDSVINSDVDENGLRHVMLCRAILGKMEMVSADTKQVFPSSTEFDSGVDNLADPSKYIVWSCYMNTHIFIGYVVSFRFPYTQVFRRMQGNAANSGQVCFSNFMTILSRFLDAHKMALIAGHYNEFQDNKITKQQFLPRVKQVVGDRLFIAVLRLYKNELVIMNQRGM